MSRWTWNDTIPVVVRGGQLKQRGELAPLLARKGNGWCDAFDFVLIQVDENEVIFWQLNLLVSPFDADNIRTRRFQCLDQSCG